MKFSTLPRELITSEPRRVTSLKRGDSGFVDSFSFMVNRRGRVFIEARARLEETSGWRCIELRRDGKGLLHITIASNITIRRRTPGAYPFGLGLRRVTSVTVRVEEEQRKEMENRQA